MSEYDANVTADFTPKKEVMSAMNPHTDRIVDSTGSSVGRGDAVVVTDEYGGKPFSTENLDSLKNEIGYVFECYPNYRWVDRYGRYGEKHQHLNVQVCYVRFHTGRSVRLFSDEFIKVGE